MEVLKLNIHSEVQSSLRGDLEKECIKERKSGREREREREREEENISCSKKKEISMSGES